MRFYVLEFTPYKLWYTGQKCTYKNPKYKQNIIYYSRRFQFNYLHLYYFLHEIIWYVYLMSEAMKMESWFCNMHAYLNDYKIFKYLLALCSMQSKNGMYYTRYYYDEKD